MHEQASLQDFLYFLSHTSNSLTPTGKLLIQRSTPAYIYAICGSQAQTRFSIVSAGCRSSQSKSVFRSLVNDMITLYGDDVKMISSARKAITDCNLTVNLAFSKNKMLISSSLVILLKPIPS